MAKVCCPHEHTVAISRMAQKNPSAFWKKQQHDPLSVCKFRADRQQIL